MRWKVVVAVLAMSVPLLYGMSPADAATTAQTTGQVSSLASFAGKTIDLRDGWGAAKACLAVPAEGVLECFATQAQMNDAESQMAAEGAGDTGPYAYAATMGSWNNTVQSVYLE